MPLAAALHLCGEPSRVYIALCVPVQSHKSAATACVAAKDEAESYRGQLEDARRQNMALTQALEKVPSYCTNVTVVPCS